MILGGRVSFMKHLLFVCIIIIALGLISVGCKKGESAIDLSEESFQTSSITVYSDGYYGRNMDQPLEIEDTLIINQIIEKASNINKYSVVQEDELLEGLNGLWIDFNNGTVIGMYEDVDYGNIGPEKTESGSPYYHLPKGLRSYIIDILKEKKVIVVEEEPGSGIKYDDEYVFDEVKSIGMKQLMNNDTDAIIEMNIEDIEIAIEKIVGKDIVIAKEPDIAEGALKMNDQQLNIIVGYYINDVYWNARVTGVFKDEVNWYAMDIWTELEPLSQIIDRRIQLIMNNEEAMFSSNPYDYTKGNSDYEYIIGLGADTLDIMLEKLKDSEDNGLREYILAIACSELLGENIADKNWSTGKEWYALYMENILGKGSTSINTVKLTRIDIEFVKDENAKNLFLIESDDYEGFVTLIPYFEDFDYESQLPNHSKIVKKEVFTTGLGESIVVTLDMDNGTAASGKTGSHKVYYAFIKQDRNLGYMMSFTHNDKSEETKEIFIEILNSIEIK